MGSASPVSASAQVEKPIARRRESPASGQSAALSPMRAQGTWNTAPMLTRTARRFSASQVVGVSSTASTPSAAAERKIAPTFVASTMPSSTATRRAPRQASSGAGSGFLFMAQSTPRVSGKPVSFSSTAASAAYTGTPGQRASSAAALPAT